MRNERTAISGTVTFEVLGADGKPKSIFQENRLFRWLLAKGWVSPHFPKIPVLLGRPPPALAGKQPAVLSFPEHTVEVQQS
jgi:hypothetical protein